MEGTADRSRREDGVLNEDCPLAGAVARFLIWATRNNAPRPDRRISVPAARSKRVAPPETK